MPGHQPGLGLRTDSGTGMHCNPLAEPSRVHLVRSRDSLGDRTGLGLCRFPEVGRAVDVPPRLGTRRCGLDPGGDQRYDPGTRVSRQHPVQGSGSLPDQSGTGFIGLASF